MPISRFPFFSSKRRSSEAFSLLRRFGPSKRIQSCNYGKSSRNGNGKPESNPLVNVDIQAPRSWGTYVIPGALLGFVGLAAIFHYNDERRAIPKGQGNKSSGNFVKGPIIGGPFTLIDTENQTITERNLRGKWVLLYFGYTSSPDVGPEQVQVMAKAIDKLEFDPRITGLTGPVSAVRQMAQEHRIYFKKVEEEGDDYLVESSHNILKGTERTFPSQRNVKGWVDRVGRLGRFGLEHGELFADEITGGHVGDVEEAGVGAFSDADAAEEDPLDVRRWK
ncbi:hypothetical protein L484_003950 [Morus notabilis]|uniref:Uncharacterized protein n=1 Tax=Morus notabilis TaxID=981085 RepID=W9RIJ0_9ROSA|nr:hypothetical protein L484_003950 [Morus notabilis]